MEMIIGVVLFVGGIAFDRFLLTKKEPSNLYRDKNTGLLSYKNVKGGK